MTFRLERNAYDHEASYAYVLFIRKKLASPLKVPADVEEHVSRAVARMLTENANVLVAREVEGGLELMST